MLPKFRIGRTDRDNVNTIRKAFNQGICYVYDAQERTLTKYIGKFDFSIETIGVTQFYQAKVNNIQIDRAIGIPYNELIDNQCIVRIDDVFYHIIRLTYKDDRRPVWLEMVLRRSEFNYVDESE